jgi:hypothetical protein
MENQTQTPNQVPPQQIVARLAKISALLQDLQKVTEEYKEAYYTKVELKVKGINLYENIEIQCNHYGVSLDVNRVYMFLKTGNSGRMILKDGEGYVGDIVMVPLECWDKLIGALEDLIRRKLDEIGYLRNLYYTYVHTA